VNISLYSLAQNCPNVFKARDGKDRKRKTEHERLTEDSQSTNKNLKTPINCSVCNSLFTRDYPSVKKCANCRHEPLLSDHMNRLIDIEMEKMAEKMDVSSRSDYSELNMMETELNLSLCKTNESLKKQLAAKEKTIQSLREEITKLEAEKDESNQSLREEIAKLKLVIAEKFIEKTETANTPKATNHKSFAQVACKNMQTSLSTDSKNQCAAPKIIPTKKNTCALILQPSESSQGVLNQEAVSAVKKSIEKSLKPTDINFEILEFKSNHKGQIVAVLPSEQDQTNASNKLAKLGPKLGPGLRFSAENIDMSNSQRKGCPE